MTDFVPPVEFYLDFACPHSYLACVRLRETALRTGASIQWKPFLLEDLAANVGDALEPVYAVEPRHATYQLAELALWARYNGVALRRAPDQAIDSRAALRGLLKLAEAGRAMDYALAVFAACFGGCEDIADEGRLAAIAADVGLPAGALESAGASQGDEVLAGNAAELAAKGGYSSGTLFVEDQMFVGHTRMPLVEFALAQASTRQFVMPGQHG
jgi:2-hydroxychromene-2-carboxylate isomerase